MAKCIHELMFPVYNPFSNPFPSGMTIHIAELRCVCGCLASAHHGMGCTDPGFKIQCSHYKPESVVNRLPNKTEDEHEPPPM